MIWISQAIKNITERQKIFIENIKTEAALYQETEVLEVDLEEMKSIVIEEIETGGRFYSVTREISGYKEPSKTDSSKIIYLILDKEDLEEGQAIAKVLKKNSPQSSLFLKEPKLMFVISIKKTLKDVMQP